MVIERESDASRQVPTARWPAGRFFADGADADQELEFGSPNGWSIYVGWQKLKTCIRERGLKGVDAKSDASFYLYTGTLTMSK